MKYQTVLAVLLLSSTAVIAAVEEPAAPPPAQVSCDLTFASGKAGKGYAKFVDDIKAVCPTLPVCNRESEGGLENLTLLSTKEADIALVQVDTLMQMKGSDEQLGQLQIVASLHNNLLHILTKANGFDVTTTSTKETWGGLSSKQVKDTQHVDITKFSDLKGKVVGLVGSAQILVPKLNDAAGHGMTFIDYAKDDQAIEALKAGKVFAVMSLSAWPHGVIDKLTSSTGLKLVNYDLTPTAPYSLSKKNYQKLGQFGVQFLSAPNVLVTRPFAVGGQNHKNVAAVKACIQGNLAKLKDGKYQPGWGEVTDLDANYNLPKFVAPAASGKGKK